MERKKRVKRILSIVLPVVIFFAIVAGAVILVVFRNTTKLSGFDKWDPEGSDILDEHLVEQSFLTEYPYRDGGFHYYQRKAFLFSFWGGIPMFGVDTKAERSFVWLTYDDAETYRNAKQSRLDNRYEVRDDSLDGTVAYGFTFYIRCDFNNKWRGSFYPNHFTAFGYNDETQTLVFIGLHYFQSSEPSRYLDKSFGKFLKHFYGKWYDWD